MGQCHFMLENYEKNNLKTLYLEADQALTEGFQGIASGSI
jgi:hypothetical protein